MEAQEFLRRLEGIFSLDEGSLHRETVVEEIPGWDSMTFMLLIAFVDQEFSVTLQPEAVIDGHTLHDLMVLLGDHLTDVARAA